MPIPIGIAYDLGIGPKALNSICTQSIVNFIKAIETTDCLKYRQEHRGVNQKHNHVHLQHKYLPKRRLRSPIHGLHHAAILDAEYKKEGWYGQYHRQEPIRKNLRVVHILCILGLVYSDRPRLIAIRTVTLEVYIEVVLQKIVN